MKYAFIASLVLVYAVLVRSVPAPIHQHSYDAISPVVVRSFDIDDDNADEVRSAVPEGENASEDTNPALHVISVDNDSPNLPVTQRVPDYPIEPSPAADSESESEPETSPELMPKLRFVSRMVPTESDGPEPSIEPLVTEQPLPARPANRTRDVPYEVKAVIRQINSIVKDAETHLGGSTGTVSSARSATNTLKRVQKIPIRA